MKTEIVSEHLKTMKKRDRLILAAGKAIGLTLTHSNNHGGWSRGTPYTKSDVEFNPLFKDEDALELAATLGIDVPFGSMGLSVKKARLYITTMAANSA